MSSVVTLMLHHDIVAVFCISLDRRSDRWRSLAERLAQFGLRAERIEAVDGRLVGLSGGREARRLSAGELGCLLSHRQAIETAARRGLERVLVLEDDVCFHRRFAERWAEVESLGDDWDLLYLGASQYDRRGLEPLNRHGYRARKTLGTFAYMMHRRLFEQFLAVTAALDMPADVAMTRLQDDPGNRCLVCHPPLAIADVRESDIRGPRDLPRHAARMGWRLTDYDVPGMLEPMQSEWLNGFPACGFRSLDAAGGPARCAHPRVRAADGIVTRETCGSCGLRDAPSYGNARAIQAAAYHDDETADRVRPSSARAALLANRERPSVLLAIDRHGWAFHADANGLVKHLSDEFAFTIARYGELTAAAEAPRRPIETDVLVAFWWQSLLGIDTSRAGAVVTGLFETWSWDVHGPDKLQAAFDLADVLVVANQYILDDLRSHPAGFRPPAVFVCEEGVDCDIFQPQPFPAEFRVGWAGTTANARGYQGQPDGKGLGLIQEAARLAGLPLRTARRADAARGRATQWQIAHGTMGDEYYRHGSAHCVGSYSEGAPLTAGEALACGRPVIATNVGIVPRLVQHGVNGMIVPRDASALAAAMLEIKRIGPEKMAAAARRSALLFDWSQQAPKWAHAFRSALELAGRRTHARVAPRPEYVSGEWEVRRFGRTGAPPCSQG